MNVLRNVLLLAALWLLLAGVALFTLWPRIPRDTAAWMCLLVLGPPLYIAGEAFFGWLLGPGHEYSGARRFFQALAIILVYVAALLAWVVWNNR